MATVPAAIRMQEHSALTESWSPDVATPSKVCDVSGRLLHGKHSLDKVVKINHIAARTDSIILCARRCCRCHQHVLKFRRERPEPSQIFSILLSTVCVLELPLRFCGRKRKRKRERKGERKRERKG